MWHHHTLNNDADIMTAKYSKLLDGKLLISRIDIYHFNVGYTGTKLIKPHKSPFYWTFDQLVYWEIYFLSVDNVHVCILRVIYEFIILVFYFNFLQLGGKRTVKIMWGKKKDHVAEIPRSYMCWHTVIILDSSAKLFDWYRTKI